MPQCVKENVDSRRRLVLACARYVMLERARTASLVTVPLVLRCCACAMVRVSLLATERSQHLGVYVDNTVLSSTQCLPDCTRCWIEYSALHATLSPAYNM